MKKMNAPVMETVRFTEDDVIVASGAASGAGYDNKSMFLSGFGNITTGDGSIKYNGTTYSGGESLFDVLNSLYDQLGAINPAMIDNKADAFYSLSDIIGSDLGYGQHEGKDDGVSSDVNGSYYWDGVDFIKR